MHFEQTEHARATTSVGIGKCPDGLSGT